MQVVKELPPSVTLEDCHHTNFTGRTYRDVITHVKRLDADLDACNNDKQLLREWADE